jgi:hypothetical protein
MEPIQRWEETGKTYLWLEILFLVLSNDLQYDGHAPGNNLTPRYRHHGDEEGSETWIGYTGVLP